MCFMFHAYAFGGQVETSEITEITETMEITEKAVKQSNCIIYHCK